MTDYYTIIDNNNSYRPIAIAIIASGPAMDERFKKAVSEYYQCDDDECDEINFGVFSGFKPNAFKLTISIPVLDEILNEEVDLLIQPTKLY